MGKLRKIWRGIRNFLSKLWDKIKKFVAIALIVLSVALPIFASLTLPASLGWLSALGASAAHSTVHWVAYAALGVGLAYTIDDESASGFISDIGEGMSDVTAEVASVVGAGVGALAESSGLTTMLLVGGGLALAYVVMANGKEEDYQDGGTTNEF